MCRARRLERSCNQRQERGKTMVGRQWLVKEQWNLYIWLVRLQKYRYLLTLLVMLVLLTLYALGFAQDPPEAPEEGEAGADPFEQAGEQGCAAIRFIFRGTGAAIILGIVWAFAAWTLFTQKGAMWGLGIAIIVSLIIQLAPGFISFFAPAVTGTCFTT